MSSSLSRSTRPTIEPSSALGLPRRSWWRSGRSSMRFSSMARRSAAVTGVANGSSPASSASSCSRRAQNAWNVVTLGSSEGGAPRRSSTRSRRSSAAAAENVKARICSAATCSRASHVKRLISVAVLPVPAAPMTSSGPPGWVTASCWAAVSTSHRRIRRWMTPDWLGAARRAADAMSAMLAEHPTIAQRVVETGERGEGGDRTLEIDARAEQAVFTELERLHDEGARFTALSEERGLVDMGDPGVTVVVDPIDGSMNAKRGLPHHALSIAVADGPSMADVVFGYVRDFGPAEEWVAWRGQGAQLNGIPLDPTLGERRTRDGKLELVGIESADPRWILQSVEALVETTHRLRAMGTIAAT